MSPKLYFLQCSLVFFADIIEANKEEQGEFDQKIDQIEKWYIEKWLSNMLTDYCFFFFCKEKKIQTIFFDYIFDTI